MAGLACGAVILTRYREGARWNPEAISPGRAAMGLVKHTLSGQARPSQVMAAATRAVDGALGFAGPRGEASATAQALLALLAGENFEAERQVMA